MNHDTYMPDGKNSERQSNIERKAEATERNICYICIGSHGFEKFPKLKNLGTILWEWKEKDRQVAQKGSDMKQLDLIGQCRSSYRKAMREVK